MRLQPFVHLTFAIFYAETFNETGGHSMSLGLCPTKLPMTWDIWPDQPDVPVSDMARG